MLVDSIKQEHIDLFSGSEIQFSRSSLFSLFPSLMHFLLRFVLWAMRFIDIRVDKVLLQILDESVWAYSLFHM